MRGDGSVGLLSPDKCVTYVQVSGGAYSRDMRYIQMDIAPLYVRGIMSFMGITEIDVVRVEGTARSSSDPAKLLEQAKQDLLPLLARIAQ